MRERAAVYKRVVRGVKRLAGGSPAVAGFELGCGFGFGHESGSTEPYFADRAVRLADAPDALAIASGAGGSGEAASVRVGNRDLARFRKGVCQRRVCYDDLVADR